VIRGSATLDDDQNPAFPLALTDGGTWKYSEDYTCSTDKAAYDETTRKYTFPESNTATLTSGGFSTSETASTAVDCYVPAISKDANGTYDEVHDWEVFSRSTPPRRRPLPARRRTLPGRCGGRDDPRRELPGDGRHRRGQPEPGDALTVALSDALDDGSWRRSGRAPVARGPARTDGAGGRHGDLRLLGHATGDMDAASLGVDCAESNTVTAVLNGIEFPASAEILWTVNKINETATLERRPEARLADHSQRRHDLHLPGPAGLHLLDGSGGLHQWLLPVQRE